LAVLTTLCSLSGCGTTIVVRRPLSQAELARIHAVLAGEPADVEVVAANGTKVEHPSNWDLSVGVVTTSWLERKGVNGITWQRVDVPTDSLRRIVVPKRGQGALEGSIAGGLLGSAAGAGLGVLVANRTQCERCGPGTAVVILVGVGAGALVGALLGAGVGSAIGHGTTIDF